jgi:hypothetical protein
MTDERKLIYEVARCTGLIDIAIDTLESSAPQSKEEIVGLLLGARHCTISRLRGIQKSIGVEEENLLSTFKKYGSE